MPKTIFTNRSELVCGKIDALEFELQKLNNADLIHLLDDIRNDCLRMESKLIQRKQQFENSKNDIQKSETVTDLKDNMI